MPCSQIRMGEARSFIVGNKPLGDIEKVYLKNKSIEMWDYRRGSHKEKDRKQGGYGGMEGHDQRRMCGVSMGQKVALAS